MASIYDVPVKCSSCSGVVEVEPPTNRRKYAVAGALIVGLIGFFIGLSIGVATAGLGMAAFPFTALIGLYIGYRIGSWSAEKKNGIPCPECDSHIAGN